MRRKRSAQTQADPSLRPAPAAAAAVLSPRLSPHIARSLTFGSIHTLLPSPQDGCDAALHAALVRVAVAAVPCDAAPSLPATLAACGVR